MLDPAQRTIALRLEKLALSRGATPEQAREFAAAAYSESNLIPTATNKSSGAAGLFQLLSSGYRTTAQKLGGLYDVEANANAILPDYLAYWREHPQAAPGEAGAGVERSGEGADFYSKGLSLMPQPGGGVPPPSPSPGTPPQVHPEIKSMMIRTLNPDSEAASIVTRLAAGKYDPVEEVQRLMSAHNTVPRPGFQNASPSLIQSPSPTLPSPQTGSTTPVLDKKGSLRTPVRRSAPATEAGGKLLGFAEQQIGQPYVWGAESRKEGGFDCSGLVDWSMRQMGYTGPRVTTYTLAAMGESVKGKPLRPGDLIITHGGEHVVMYAGGGKVIAAPHTGTVVQYQPLSDFHIDDARRIY